MRSLNVGLLISAAVLTTACGGGGGGGDSPAPAPAAAIGPRIAAAADLSEGSSIGDNRFADGATATGATGQAVGGLQCGLTGSAYHVHSHLNIFVDGQQVGVPAKIGVVPNINATGLDVGCKYPVHTNDRSGKIHIETPAPTTFTLGQFFQLWGQSLTTTNVAGQTGKPISFYLDDGATLTPYTGDPAQIELADHRGITIVIGTPPADVPTYSWANTPPLAATTVQITGAQVGSTYWPVGDTVTGGQGQTIDGIACGPMIENYHEHTHLAIFVDGQQRALPSQVGIVSPTSTSTTDCHYQLHTHDASGKIHAEAETIRRFTLGNVFDIWGQALQRDNVAGVTGLPVKSYIVNGFDVVEFNGDLREIDLRTKRNIVLQIGAPLTEIPSYNWSGN